jgi:hypothetical protein
MVLILLLLTLRVSGQGRALMGWIQATIGVSELIVAAFPLVASESLRHLTD